ncbi:Stk1 family PASTA domain-containing Ser/Thr kinase [Thermobifida fusca]|nr:MULTISPECIES: Stk1 family PASTA domain-containing Ser/Thr kinase [Thermobifida]AAZ57099.1 serine/threonine protein kinase [Thermobifida fusca YX]MBO2530146.1 serine/threonine protein kinase [Thermobifida sp.]PZN60304.1 MAG: Stk1 family PASTA domain-containing Ser/Thr kinase [Thermobifida fusca]QOS59522.1 Stk1 family PASTA domain-containing Ser/Thr kinase [Thermobifida fusca]
MSQPRLLGGRYQLEAPVGRGGMAEVFRARDLRLDRLVAVKTLRSDLARDPTFQARFRREAQSAASLNHPSIIAVYDTGEDVIDGVPIPYIVMEYVDGRTLKELLEDNRRLLPERTLEITDGILRALAAAHARGIVHRDIKPANVMLTRQAEVKVMDFGIARAMNDAQATMTQTSQVIGTAQYLSPEQARGERVDVRSDIYSTGCVLYELLTGRPPFVGDSPVSIAYQHVREEPIPPTELDPEIPEWIEAIVLRAMAKDREQRYQTAEEMRADIQRGLQGMPTAASTMALSAANDGATTALPPTRDDGYDDYDDYPYDDEDRRRGSGNKVLWVLLGTAVLAAAAFLGWLLFNPGTDNITIPNVAGMSVEEATETLQEKGFENIEVADEPTPSNEIEEGKVVGTDPEIGETVPPDTEITILISGGPEMIEMPDLVGMSQADALGEINRAGLARGEITHQESDEPQGTVLSTDPKAGTEVEPGTKVNLVVAKASTKVEVPSLAGMNEDQARERLAELGLTLEAQTQETSDATPGTAIAQSPQAGTKVERGTTVTVTFAKEPQRPEPPTPPDPGSPGDETPFPPFPPDMEEWNPFSRRGEGD